jgi:DNA-binding MarR family transcriptional regulator
MRALTERVHAEADPAGATEAADAAELQAAEAIEAAGMAELTRAVRAVLRVHRGLERLDTGLTAQQFRIMSLVADGGERSARLAARLAVSKPTLTAVADGLVAAGYLSRQDEPGDRRVVRLALTDAGRAAYARAGEVYASWFGLLIGETGDPKALVRLLIDIDDALDRDRRPRTKARDEGGA